MATATYWKASDTEDPGEARRLYDGEGQAFVKFFSYTNDQTAVKFLSYTMPPGASEGIHTHTEDSHSIGVYDEHYYIVSGEGSMRIAGEDVRVKTGDYIYTPLGVSHGLTNTSRTRTLKIFMATVKRASR